MTLTLKLGSTAGNNRQWDERWYDTLDDAGSVAADTVFGMSSLCGLSWPPRWSLVLMGSILAMTNVNHTDVAVMTTVHEIGHSAFMLPDHPANVDGGCGSTTDTPMVGDPSKKKCCAMFQCIPDPDETDYWQQEVSHMDRVVSVDFSPDGKLLAAGIAWDAKVMVWRIR